MSMCGRWTGFVHFNMGLMINVYTINCIVQLRPSSIVNTKAAVTQVSTP
jgi:hypothetical protein